MCSGFPVTEIPEFSSTVPLPVCIVLENVEILAFLICRKLSDSETEKEFILAITLTKYLKIQNKILYQLLTISKDRYFPQSKPK